MEIIRGVYVDSFRLKRPNSVYFLTHWHSGMLKLTQTITKVSRPTGAMVPSTAP